MGNISVDMFHLSSMCWPGGIVVYISCQSYFLSHIPQNDLALCHQTGPHWSTTIWFPAVFRVRSTWTPVPAHANKANSCYSCDQGLYSKITHFKKRALWQQLWLPWWHATFLPSPVLIYTAADESLHHIVLTDMCRWPVYSCGTDACHHCHYKPSPFQGWQIIKRHMRQWAGVKSWKWSSACLSAINLSHFLPDISGAAFSVSHRRQTNRW